LDPSVAFKDKSDIEIARAWLVFRLCAIRPVVENAAQLLNLSRQTRPYTHTLLHNLRRIYSHFIARARFMRETAQSRDDIRCRVMQLSRATSDSRHRTLLGDRITFDLIVRHTFFEHFCGGTSGESIQSTVSRLQQQNVGAILDYAAEADVDPTPKQGIISARSYEYQPPPLTCELILGVN
jgi:hypothetical protein